MKRDFLLIGLALLITSGILNAQDNKTEVYSRDHIPNKKPVPYVSTREADVMWEKTIWRMVDLREKMNLPLYYPSKPIGGRMSLIDLLLYGIDHEGLTAYSTGDDLNEFKIPLTKPQIEVNLGAVPDTIRRQAQGLPDTIIPGSRKTYEVKQLLIKEKWFFDKQYSTLQVRIIGICPIRIYTRPDDSTQIQRKKLFWIYYPDVRNLFASHELFNRFNDAQRISFDDLFLQRRFNSFIYAESNVYDNRTISDYATNGLESLYESDKIKESMSQMEHDLWEY
jgi:gliding motility associated protien GldN